MKEELFAIQLQSYKTKALHKYGFGEWNFYDLS